MAELKDIDSLGSPSFKTLSRSTSQNSNDSIFNYPIELPRSILEDKGSSFGIISPVKLADEPSSKFGQGNYVCVDEIGCYIPFDDSSELSFLLHDRLPELRKMFQSAEELLHLGKKLSEQMSRDLASCMEALNIAPKPELESYRAMKSCLSTNTAIVLRHAESLVQNFNEFFQWYVQVPEEFNIKWLGSIENNLRKRIFELFRVNERLSYFLYKVDPIYKQQFFCLRKYSVFVTTKMMDLLMEEKNVGFYLSWTDEIRSLKKK